MPDAPFGVRQKASNLLVDGRPTRPDAFGETGWPIVETAVLGEPTFSESYQSLCPTAGAAAPRWVAMSPVDPGGAEPKIWFLVAMPGNLVALELVTRRCARHVLLPRHAARAVQGRAAREARDRRREGGPRHQRGARRLPLPARADGSSGRPAAAAEVPALPARSGGAAEPGLGEEPIRGPDRPSRPRQLVRGRSRSDPLALDRAGRGGGVARPRGPGVGDICCRWRWRRATIRAPGARATRTPRARQTLRRPTARVARPPERARRPGLRAPQVRGANDAHFQAPVPVLRQVHRPGRRRLPVLRPGRPVCAQALSELPQDRRGPGLGGLSVVRPIVGGPASGRSGAARDGNESRGRHRHCGASGCSGARPGRCRFSGSRCAASPAGAPPAPQSGRGSAGPQVGWPLLRLWRAATCRRPLLHDLRDRGRVSASRSAPGGAASRPGRVSAALDFAGWRPWASLPAADPGRVLRRLCCRSCRRSECRPQARRRTCCTSACREVCRSCRRTSRCRSACRSWGIRSRVR